VKAAFKDLNIRKFSTINLEAIDFDFGLEFYSSLERPFEYRPRYALLWILKVPPQIPFFQDHLIPLDLRN